MDVSGARVQRIAESFLGRIGFYAMGRLSVVQVSFWIVLWVPPGWDQLWRRVERYPEVSEAHFMVPGYE
jgi:hypothetical protein